MRCPAAIALTVCLPFAASAQSFTAVNGLAVVPLDADSMEVVEIKRTGSRGVWCAAADFVRQRLGNPRRAEIYVMVPRGASRSVQGSNGTIFTIAPDPSTINAKPSYSASVSEVGVKMSVSQAYKYCSDVDKTSMAGNG